MIMNTPLKSSSLTEEELIASDSDIDEEQLEEEEAHIHLPGPSLWPALLSVAIALVFIGLLMIGTATNHDTSGVAPWLIFIGLPGVLIGIMGWALENPDAHGHGAHGTGSKLPTSFADAARSGKQTIFDAQVLDQAQAVVVVAVTIGRTACGA